MKSKISFRLLLSLYVPNTFVPFFVVNYPSQITDFLLQGELYFLYISTRFLLLCHTLFKLRVES
jgi:hypothetical protein